MLIMRNFLLLHYFTHRRMKLSVLTAKTATFMV